jgi:hypothetical protein
MDGIFNTAYWRANGGVGRKNVADSPGSTDDPSGKNAADAKAAKTNVYGYLLATVNPDRTIDFRFHEVEEKDVPPGVVTRFSQGFVHQCFIANRSN